MSSSACPQPQQPVRRLCSPKRDADGYSGDSGSLMLNDSDYTVVVDEETGREQVSLHRFLDGFQNEVSIEFDYDASSSASAAAAPTEFRIRGGVKMTTKDPLGYLYDPATPEAGQWTFWNEVCGRHSDYEVSLDSPVDGSDRRTLAGCLNFDRQDSCSGDAELYSFEDYVTPMTLMTSPAESDVTHDEFVLQSRVFRLNRFRRSAKDERGSNVSLVGDIEASLKAVNGIAKASRVDHSADPIASLETLSLNHKISYFFNSGSVAETERMSHGFSYDEIGLSQTHPLSAESTNSSVDPIDSPEIVQRHLATGPFHVGLGQVTITTPLYHTTPPLSQIPRRRAIKHKRRLVRANTVSSNSILKRDSENGETGGHGQAKEGCSPSDIYNSDGSLTTQLGGIRDWPNSAGIHSSLSLPNRLNEDADKLSQHYNSDPPDPPTNVTLSVVSDRSLLVTFRPPKGQTTEDIIGYTVEWSRFPGFQPLNGTYVIANASDSCHEIRDLDPGTPYYVRVKAVNLRGAGPATPSSPSYAVPSDWKEIDGVAVRTEGKRHLLDELYGVIRNTLNDPLRTGSQIVKTAPAWKKVRSTFRSIFSSAPKFHKSTKSGIYLAVLIYHEGRVLVTNDDVIPVVEVDPDYMPTAATLNADLQWMNKITCNWYSVKILRQLLHKIALSNLNTSQFRRGLLQIVLQLQVALGIKDLGQLYHRPMRDASSGAVVLTTTCCLGDSKSVNTTHVRWASLRKLHKKSSDGCFDPSIIPASAADDESPQSLQPTSIHFDLLKASTEMIEYCNGTSCRLPRGLYLGYLRLGSSLDQINVWVDRCHPNVLPFVKVRDNHHVSREEWSVIREQCDSPMTTTHSTHAQETFRRQLTSSCDRLFDKLGLDESSARDHRFYQLEILELSSDVSMVIVLPPPDLICTGPGQKETVPPTCLSLSLHTFEIIHMRTYHPDLIRRYSQLSNFLEIDLRIAQQELRMGISEEDTKLAQSRVDLLTDLLQRLEDTWRAMRWIVDITTKARDKKVVCGLDTDRLQQQQQQQLLTTSGEDSAT